MLKRILLAVALAIAAMSDERVGVDNCLDAVRCYMQLARNGAAAP